ncbi:Eco57I restriction-modification methylase domain-containing protein [Glutamicibacter sp. NPDC087583]|uniref:Eco57I restriction-modification methylase domain-containing protein n=1 Tax=Glutamicibacter sp. NPDC087583 TaxID=3363995 RepID=UPI0038000256
MSGSFQAITVVGGVLPPAMLGRIQTGNLQDRTGLDPASYFLSGRETIGDAASRSWSYLKGVWQDWQDVDARKSTTGPGTGDARQRWLLILLRELGYGQVPPAGSGVEDRSTYPVSHLWGSVPIHLLGPRVQLDKRNPGIDGAAKAPQKMLQEFLNHKSDYLWGILSNGFQLRLLRDSTALAGSAYIEFDLETIFNSELYPEFQLLWQLCHQSRLAPRDTESGPESCWLESWRSESVESGSRALDRLGVGVQHALEQLGTGLLQHPDNAWLVEALRADDLSRHDFHKALLRTAYRLLFCFVVEDRGALHTPEASAEVRGRYAEFFSTRRLRDLSRKHDGGPHKDLWQTQKLVLRALGGDGLEALGLPALGGLFDPDPRAAVPATQPGSDIALACEIANRDLLRAVRSLSWVKNSSGRVEPVDYRHLGAEEFGSVYESLLELIPRLDLEAKTFELENVAGNERKVTGSYYTPPNLVSALLDTTLDPLLDEAVREAADLVDAERRLLELTVCDPASGSGGFLVAAARRMARRLAEVRAGEDEPTPEEIRHALHDVVDRCIYGVDMNDLAAELAKVSLWLEAMVPGKPLTFLDSRIKIGNSLIGATPSLMAAGIPDEAFKPLDGDEKSYASEVRKVNKTQAKSNSDQYIQHLGQDSLNIDGAESSFEKLIADRQRLNRPSSTAADARRLAREYATFDESEDLRMRRLEADAWCASFVWRLDGEHPNPPTNSVFRNIGTAYATGSWADTINEVASLRNEYRFFHWHLEFPEIFGDPSSVDANGPDGWPGGFSCLLGNPPWEHVELKEQEYFAAQAPEIANATGAKRKKMIKELPLTDPLLAEKFEHDKRIIDGQRHFYSVSGKFPLTGRGRIKTDSVFAELFRDLSAPRGSVGVIVPTGIATDHTTQYFFRDLVEKKSIVALFDFENAAPIFDGVHRSYKFCLLTLNGRFRISEAARFAFFLHDPALIESSSFELTPEEIRLLNPNTGTLPIFRTRRDAEITLGIYKRVPVLINENDSVNGNPWGVSFRQGLFNMTSDSHLFQTREQLEQEGWSLSGNIFRRQTLTGELQKMFPLYEAKMIHQFDHRWATYDGLDARDVTQTERMDPSFEPTPRYWVSEIETLNRAGGNTGNHLLVFRDIARSTDERTAIFAEIPLVGVGHTAPIMRLSRGADVASAIANSFVFDYVTRQKVGGTHLTYSYLKQLPFPHPEMFFSTETRPNGIDAAWVGQRVIELSDCSIAMNEHSYVWDDARRTRIRAEIDAAMLHIFGMDRESAVYLLDSFEITARKDHLKYGEFLTKKLVLEVYDAMHAASLLGQTYDSPLLPPPGQGARHILEEMI